MKRFWLVLLSLGLIVAFSTSAMAVDVKFSGEYYAAGLYLDKTTLRKDSGTDGPSTAFYFQRLRLRTDFVVSPGLSLIARADIMERAWGAPRSNVPLVTSNDTMSAGTRAENENIVFDLLYAQYVSPIGMFMVGYQIDGAYGTVFGDTSMPTPRIAYILPIKGFTIGLITGKNPDGELSKTAINPATAADRDSSFYTAFVNYAWKTGQGGFLYKYIRNATVRGSNFIGNTNVAIGFAKQKLGPVDLQAELYHIWGQGAKWEAGTPDDTRLSMLYGWVDATANFGMFYAGGSIAYVSGNDPGNGAVRGASGGLDYKPTLILFNSDLNYWAGAAPGYGGSSTGGALTNAWFGQIRGGVKPVDKLDIGLSVSYASADKKPSATWLYNDYGYEVDLTATYKITNNLSYMLGGGYLFTGKYFKGVDEANSLTNDFLVINKLTLTF
ncbi:MAG: hypothetical protein Q8O28_10980 [Smithellaceae bacterium]|nr:hypothetical protein [Smithellaceae bacterium]